MYCSMAMKFCVTRNKTFSIGIVHRTAYSMFLLATPRGPNLCGCACLKFSNLNYSYYVLYNVQYSRDNMYTSHIKIMHGKMTKMAFSYIVRVGVVQIFVC